MTVHAPHIWRLDRARTGLLMLRWLPPALLPEALCDNRDMAPADTVASLCERYQVDMAHARHVADCALALYDGAAAFHALPPRARELIETGALLHNVALEVDEPNHHIAGRDIVLASSLDGVAPEERAILALIVVFHRKAVAPDQEPIFAALTAEQQKTALLLSAIVRVADGLDYSQTASTRIKDITPETWRAERFVDDQSITVPMSGLHVRVRGPFSHEDTARAMKKADLWMQLLPPIRFSARMNRAGLNPDMTVAEAGRRILRYQFDQLPDVGADPAGKDIRKMRVAIRRMRTTLREFRPFYKRKGLRDLQDGLRALIDLLRPVREVDMTIDSLDRHVAAEAPAERAGLAQLRAAWQTDAAAAREALTAHVAGEEHTMWRRGVLDFVTTDEHDRIFPAGVPSRVRHAAAAIVANHCAVVLAYDTLADGAPFEQVHALRIAVKRLRYITDALGDVLPKKDVKALQVACVEAQDRIGAMNDAHVTATRALEFVAGLPATREGRVAMKDVLLFADECQRVAAQSLDVKSLTIFSTIAGIQFAPRPS